MSAYKTAYIRLGEAEYKRLREAEERLRLHDLNHSQKESDQQNSIYENMLGIKKQNDYAFQKLVLDLESEISKIENEASTWVECQAQLMQNHLSQNQESIRNSVSSQIDEIITAANSQFEQQEAAFQAYWADQTEKILRQENKERAYADQARTWIQKNREVLDFIYCSYPVNAQMANQLELQRQYLNQVIQQYNNEFFDIAASSGFQIFNNLSNIRFQIDVDRTIQVTHYQKLIENANRLLETTSQSSTIYAMDADGNELPDLIDVDYWIEGRLREFTVHLTSIFDRIASDPWMNIDQIVNYDHQINDLSEQLTDLVTTARIAVLASQLRFNVAQIIVQSLESQGFFLDQASYEKDDYREAFTAHTCNFAGNEVMVTIDPDPGLEEGGKLHIQSLDADQITEHELLQRNREIFTAIAESGIKVGEIQEVSESLPDKNKSNKHLHRKSNYSLQSQNEGKIDGRN